jgi:hypothetical protein
METISQVRQEGAYLLLYRPPAGVYFNPWLKFHFYVRGMLVRSEYCRCMHFRKKKVFKKGDFFIFYFFMYVIQHCFICRLSDSTVSVDAGNELGLGLWRLLH